jgi:hypothetical protein
MLPRIYMVLILDGLDRKERGRYERNEIELLCHTGWRPEGTTGLFMLARSLCICRCCKPEVYHYETCSA